MNVQIPAGAPADTGASGAPDAHHRATLVDVACAAGVSRQTVSNVINYPQRVAPATRERVSREIERLGFKPNPAARALRRRKANALGIQLNPRSHGGLGRILDFFLVELAVAARRYDVHVVTFAVESHGDPTAEYEHLLAMQMVDGFILTDTCHHDARPDWLRRNAVPFASFGRVWDDPAFTSWVDVDGFAGAVAAVRHLAAQGYRRIGFLGWPSGSPVGDDRRAGWEAATRELDIHEPRLQASSAEDVLPAAAAGAPVLTQLAADGALICASDTLALGAWTVLRDRGVRPGVETGLVGFDDSDIARSLGITSLRQPLPEIAETMLDLVMDRGTAKRQAAGDAGALTNLSRQPDGAGVLLQPSVVVRPSSCRAPSPDPVVPHRSAPPTAHHGGTT